MNANANEVRIKQEQWKIFNLFRKKIYGNSSGKWWGENLVFFEQNAFLQHVLIGVSPATPPPTPTPT